MNTESDPQKDKRFTKWMIKNVGLLGIPPSVFFSDDHKTIMENFVRYCFLRKDENLKKVADVLKEWANKK